MLPEEVGTTLSLDGSGKISLAKASSIAPSRDQRKAVRDASSSIFSALSSFLLSTSGPSESEYDSAAYQQQPTPEQVETENACRSVVSECSVSDLFSKQFTNYDRATTPVVLQHLLTTGQLNVVNGEMQMLK